MSEYIERLQCVPRILSARNRMLGGPLDRDELADLAQEVAVSTLRKLDQYEGRASLETWLYGVASWELMNRARRRWRSRVKLGEEVPESDASRASMDPARLVVEDETAQLREGLFAHVEALPADEAEVVRLKHEQGLSFAQIGDRLGTSPHTLKSRYYRALSRLRSALAPLREEVL